MSIDRTKITSTGERVGQHIADEICSIMFDGAHHGGIEEFRE